MGMVIAFLLWGVAVVFSVITIGVIHLCNKKAKQREVNSKYMLHIVLSSIPLWLLIFYFPVDYYTSHNDFDALITVWSTKTALTILSPAVTAIVILVLRTMKAKQLADNAD